MRGVALVIGNGAYRHVAALPNPDNDARAIEKLLSDLGFETTLVSDRDARRLARDLDAFADDAEGADVAIVYYSGHGIEAGGENFLVPVDADLSALDAAGERLVPTSSLLDRLEATVAVTILMLDACRDNPFPTGAAIRLDASAPALPISQAGLGEARGASRLGAASAERDNFGTVLAFAAEPGRAALDGAPGANSPYAAAILRHLDAMAGEEFGMVMRMVGEEVYLKTGGHQRPWINESLRRQLYFGDTVDRPEGPEGDILRERRQLLLTISTLPDPERRRVENAASGAGVPMDAVYAMLRALGKEVPEDPAKLEELLRQQAQDLKNFLDDRRTIANPDPELAQLAALTDRAVQEGAITTARALREQADRRIDKLSAVIDQAEEDIRNRRVEFAAEYERSAEIAALAFRHLEAADYYRKAFDQIERWEDDLAWRYRFAEVRSLGAHGDFQGDNMVLLRAVDVGEQALNLVNRTGDRDRWADMQNQIGLTLSLLGGRTSGTEYLRRAETAIRAALTVRSRERTPVLWAGAQINLANVLGQLGMREPGTVLLEEAMEALKLALTVYTRKDQPAEWANANSNLGNILLALAQRRGGTVLLKEAIATLHSALLEQTRETSPYHWANNQNNLGLAFMRLGGHEAQLPLLELAIEKFQAALLELSREGSPLGWAQTQMNIGGTLVVMGALKTDVALLQSGIDTLHGSLEAFSREQDTPLWGQTQAVLAGGYLILGTLRNDPEPIEHAVIVAERSLEVLTLEHFPFEWTSMQQTAAKAKFRVGQMRLDQPLLDAALSGLRTAIARIPRDDLPAQWLDAKTTEADFLSTIGQLRSDPVRLGESVDAYTEVLVLLSPEISWVSWATARTGRGRALFLHGSLANDEAMVWRSAKELKEVGDFVDRQQAPLQWAVSYQYLGDCFLWLGAMRSDQKLVSGAIASYGFALEVFKPDAMPVDWGLTRGGLAFANVVAGALASDRNRMQLGRADIVATRERTRASGMTKLDPYFDKFIAVADQFLAQQPADGSK